MTTPFGPYELLERLGEGGMAEVWSAKKRGAAGFEMVVCIKRIRGDQRDDAGAAERFLREARVLGRLHHSNIGRIYDAGQVGDEYFIEMEYLRGKDLRTVLKTMMDAGATPPMGLGIAIAAAVGRALDHAHGLCAEDGTPDPVIHRDVTAANIMLCFDGGIKLVDFGLAKAMGNVNPRLTMTGVYLGTTGYIAPEVQRGTPAAAKSDQFSLGVIFYEALTGRRMLDPMVARERPPSQCSDTIPAVLDAICLRAIAEDPAQRFPSCGAFIDAIEAAVPNGALGAGGIAALLTERFKPAPSPQPKPTASPSPSPAPSPSPKPTPTATATATPTPKPTATATPTPKPTPSPPRSTTPGTPRARRASPPPSNRGTYLLALAIILVSVIGALGVRLWRARTAAPLPAIVPAATTPPPAAAQPRSANPTEAEPEPAPAPKPAPGSQRRRKRTTDGDMQLMQQSGFDTDTKKRAHRTPGSDDLQLTQPQF